MRSETSTSAAKTIRTQQQNKRQKTNLLLGTKLVGVTTLLLAAVDGAQRQTGVAFTADLLVAVLWRPCKQAFQELKAAPKGD